MILRQDLVDRLKFHLSTGQITDPTLTTITDQDLDDILKQKTLSLGYFYPDIPLANEEAVMLLTRKEIYWKMALVSAPLYEMSMGDLQVSKQVRFDHYIQLIEMVEKDYKDLKNDPNKVKIEVQDTLVNTVYNQRKIVNNFVIPTVKLNVDSVILDRVNIDIQYINLNPKDFVYITVYTSDEPLVDKYSNEAFDTSKGTHHLEIRDIHKKFFNIVKPKKYISAVLKLYNGLESYTELELKTDGN